MKEYSLRSILCEVIGSATARAVWLATALAFAMIWPAGSVPAQTPLESEFTYQGRLVQGGLPANDTFDFEFRLFDVVSGGVQLTPTVTRDDVAVADGQFTVTLNFGDMTTGGDDLYTEEKRWLEIGVRPGADTGAFTTLAPRQALTPAPFAIFALEAVDAEFLDDIPAAGFWQTTGNDIVTPPAGVNILGSGNAQPLELWAGGSRALRLESPAGNIIAGSSANVVLATAFNGTIAGGDSNQVTDSLGTVSGGRDNRAGDADADPSNADGATVGGGAQNVAGAGSATVGGGTLNVAGANSATVAGGTDNAATGRASAIGGGETNRAGGDSASVPGGAFNKAEGATSFAAGFKAEALHDAAFVWNGSSSIALPELRSTGSGQFLVGAMEIWFGNGTVAPSFPGYLNTWTGAFLSGGGVWTNASDAELKENFVEVDGREILDRLDRMPISSWNYKVEDRSVRHLGPTAQDFSAAFGLGEGDRAIGTVDADGIALAAIKALHARLLEKDRQIEALSARLEALERTVGNAEPGVEKGGPAESTH